MRTRSRAERRARERPSTLTAWKHLTLELDANLERPCLHAPTEHSSYPLEARAYCLAHAAVPARRCGCGFTAFERSLLPPSPAGLLLAEVELSGRWRAERRCLRGEHQRLVGLELDSCARYTCPAPATALWSVAHERTDLGRSRMLRGVCTLHAQQLPPPRCEGDARVVSLASLQLLLEVPLRRAQLDLVPEMRAPAQGS